MAHQTNPERYSVTLKVDLTEAAQLRTYIKGKTAPAYVVGGRRIVKKTRPMTLGDLYESLGHQVSKGIEPDEESVRWMEEQRKRLRAQRKHQDDLTKEGKNRKDPKDFLKTGPKVGNPSPKFLQAMAELGAKRREMAKKGLSFKSKSKSKTKGKDKAKENGKGKMGNGGKGTGKAHK